MNNIYLGLFLSLICVLLAFLYISKLFIGSFFCVILAAIYFKDDFSPFRYLATHVASFYQWICESYYYLLNMYHQSNNTNSPIRKCLENNGTVLSKLHPRTKQNVTPNLTSSYLRGVQQSRLLSSPSLSPGTAINKTRSPVTNMTSLPQLGKENVASLRIDQYARSVKPRINIGTGSPSFKPSSPVQIKRNDIWSSQSSITNVSTVDQSASKSDRSTLNSPVDAKLYANVTSPGFCSRIAEGLSNTMTHQPKYDSVGSFPLVHLTNLSPKVKIKKPVRVRIAPPSSELMYSSSTISTRSPVMGAEESMKSVLQVLKEISRKRIHSQVDEDSDENRKRLRISEAQFNKESMLHPSLLQQTIQGKRAREENSPNEEDVKKKRKSVQNNEILSSLSSSMAIKPPHLKTKKRKAPAIDDSISSTPVLGKLLKVQTEVTPPLKAPTPTQHMQESIVKPVPPEKPLKLPDERLTPLRAEEPEKVGGANVAKSESKEDDSTVSRLLGRMSGQTSRPVPPQHIDITNDPFTTVNDLSLSPPKENRLAAMIAVLGGPSNLDVESTSVELSRPPEIKGKALFTSPVLPETPKQKKNVTFSESLTTTKLFDQKENPSTVSSPLAQTSLSTLTSIASSTSLPKLDFGSPSSSASLNLSSPSSTDTKSQNPDLNVTSTGSVATATTQSGLFSFQPTSSSTLTSSVNPIPSTFTFGSSNPSNKESTLSQSSTDSSVQKMFSFGSDKKTTLGTTLSSTASVTAIGKIENTLNSTTDSNKLNLFNSSNVSPNKNDPNKPLVNGLTSNAGIPLALNVTTTQPSANKLNFPDYGITSSTTLQTQSSPMFSFVSAQSTAPLTSASTSSGSLFTNAQAKVTTPSQNSSVFGQSSDKTSGFNAVATSLGSSIFSNNTNTTQASLFGNVNSQSPATSKNTTQTGSAQTTGSLFGSTPSTQVNSPFSITLGNSVSQGNTMFGNLSATSQSGGTTFNAANNSLFPTAAGQISGFNGKVQGAPKTTSSSSSSVAPTFGSQNNTPVFAFGGQNSINGPVSFGNQSNNSPASTFGNQSSTSTPTFGNQSKTLAPTFGSQSSTPATTFGNQSGTPTPTFGSQGVTSASTFGSQSGTPTPTFGSQGVTSAPTFGCQSGTPTPTFGSQGVTSAPTFGSQSGTPTPTFGSQNSTPTPTFGGQSSTIAPSFGSQSGTPAPTFGNQGTTQAPTFGIQNTTSTPGPIFGNQNTTSAPVPTFGSQSSTSAPTFGAQINKPVFAFGSQNNATPPAFGSQNNSPAPAFGNQNPTQPGFNSSFTTTTTGESKPMFMFGSTTANKDSVKPFGAAAPYSFGSPAQPSTNTAPSVPSFGTSSGPPTFGATTTQQPPAFGAATAQPTAPVFAFGQASSAPAPAFQFNAATPQPAAAGGMFSIGSGSSAPRSKQGAVRRRHKMT